MEIITKTPHQCTEEDVRKLSRLAGIGFGQSDTPAMHQDSLNHIAAANYIQLSYQAGELLGFAMLRSCLWR